MPRKGQQSFEDATHTNWVNTKTVKATRSNNVVGRGRSATNLKVRRTTPNEYAKNSATSSRVIACN